MSTRDQILANLGADEETTDAETDEIVAALTRQLDVMEGSLVIAANMVQLLLAQAQNLRAEVALLGVPPEPLLAPARVETVTRPSGAKVEGTLPEEARLPDFCSHPDALLVPTVDGLQRVCQDCTEEAAGHDDH